MAIMRAVRPSATRRRPPCRRRGSCSQVISGSCRGCERVPGAGCRVLRVCGEEGCGWRLFALAPERLSHARSGPSPFLLGTFTSLDDK